jgi:hypothetical protein
LRFTPDATQWLRQKHQGKSIASPYAESAKRSQKES